MGILNHYSFNFRITPPPAEGTRVGIDISPQPLFRSGVNLPVELSTATLFRSPPLKTPLSSIVVLAHFDTGASFTSIDIGLAKHLNLIATGQSESQTASGLQIMPNFAIDVSFPNTKLSPFFNLSIGSCRLNFDLTNNMNQTFRKILAFSSDAI